MLCMVVNEMLNEFELRSFKSETPHLMEYGKTKRPNRVIYQNATRCNRLSNFSGKVS